MLVYISPIILACVGLLLRSRNLLLFLAVFLAFIIGMGVGVGADYHAYIYMQESAPSLFDPNFRQEFSFFCQERGIEITYAFINTVLKTLGLGGQYVFILMAILSSFFIYKICRKFSFQLAYVVFIVSYVLAISGLWNQVRYGLAILMVFYACLVFIEKRYFSALALICLAASIHSISLAIIVVLISYEILRKINVSISVVAFAVLIFSLGLVFVDVKSILMFAMQYFNPRYAAYEETGGTYANFFIRLCFCATLFMLLSWKNIKQDPKLFMLFILTSWSLIIWSLAWRTDILYRVGVMFEFGYLLFIVRSAYSKFTYFLVGASLLALLMAWRLIKAVDILNEYSFYFY